MRSNDIHFLSSNITKTLRSSSEDTNSINGQLLTRAGAVHQIAAGIFTILPLGMRVLSRIETIVREEMNSTGSFELLAPTLQPRHLLDASGRWDAIDVLYRVTSRQASDFCLAATAEEATCATLKSWITSYRDLPLSVYQIADKFRDEPRPRAGLLRGRYFRMKDLYSYHTTLEDLDAYYETVVGAYMRVFQRCGIADKVRRTFASGGVFSQFSDEFQLLAESGEDTVYLSDDSSVAINKEVAENAEALRAVFGDKVPRLREHRAIEVGNTFKLGTRFTDAFQITFQNEAGSREKVYMGTYGIGTTRLMGSVAEVLSDSRGLVWPREIAPYDAHVVVLGDEGASSQVTQRVIEALSHANLSALVDDRTSMRAGEKFADADLIGIPVRIVVSDRTGQDSLVEVKRRTADGAERISVDALSAYICGE